VGGGGGSAWGKTFRVAPSRNGPPDFLRQGLARQKNECRLNQVLVTPRMHGIHHSQVQRENNTNFGTVSPRWDRLHRTLGVNIPQDEVVVGIPAFRVLFEVSSAHPGLD